jgi:hypothetical protein
MTTPQTCGPCLAQKVMSLGSSVAKWATSGFIVSNAEQIGFRIKTCKSCEFFINEKNSRCGKCGCFTSPKIMMATEKCPIDKWGAIEVESPQ